MIECNICGAIDSASYSGDQTYCDECGHVECFVEIEEDEVLKMKRYAMLSWFSTICGEGYGCYPTLNHALEDVKVAELELNDTNLELVTEWLTYPELVECGAHEIREYNGVTDGK